MLKLLKNNINKENTAPVKYDLEPVGKKSFEEALILIRKLFSEPSAHKKEELEVISSLEIGAMHGEIESKQKLIEKIKNTMDRFGIDVTGMAREEASLEIYKYSWGLGPLEEIYDHPDVDEVEVVDTKTVYTIRKGVYTKENVEFNTKDELLSLIKRILRSDRVDLNERNPRARSVRADGTRVVATGPPITSQYTLSLRKHNTFVLTKENLVNNGTMDGETYEKLALMSEGRLNILFSGPVNAGKTSLIRHFFRYSQPELRSVAIEPDSELRLLEQYPGWNIIELEEQIKLKMDNEELFELALQLSPVRIIIGEILGLKELRGAVKAGIRGQTGNFSTYHSRDIRQALHNLAITYSQDFSSVSMSLDLAMTWIVQAFDVVVQLWTDPKRGLKKVIHIASPRIDKDRGLVLDDIVKWHGSEDDYCSGYYEHLNIPERVQEILHQNGVPEDKIVRCHRPRA
jgi:pilus assembly protein CpaF